MKLLLNRAVWVLAALVISNISNEASNALTATALPWGMRSADVNTSATLLMTTLLFLSLAGFCWLIKKTVQHYGLRKVLAATIITTSFIIAMSMINVSVNIIWVIPALIVIMLVEPFIEFCSSALSPLAAEKANIDKQRFSAILLALGSLSTFAAPWLAPVLQTKFGQPGLAYTLLALSLISLISLTPLLAAQNFEASLSIKNEDTKPSKNPQMQQVLNWLPLLVALLVAFEAAWLPAILSGSTHALTLQASFVSFAALGAVIGAGIVISVNMKSFNLVARLITALFISMASTGLMALYPNAITICSGAILIGICSGMCLPLLEATLQAQFPDAQTRMLGLIMFSTHMCWRIAMWLMLVAIIAYAGQV
jgi:MFS family permease